jgi:hypothetical protein
MITETAINLYPTIKYLGFFIVIGIGLFLIHNLGGMKIFSKHDNKMINQFLDKFPLVSPDFYKKTKTEQLAENNQEIHEINKRLDSLETNYAYISEQLKRIMGEIKKNG